jgi:hypothetical protein
MEIADLSTNPGLNDPVLPVEAGGDVLARNPVKGQVTLKASWTAGTINVPLPLRLWNARALILNGLADPEVMAKVLAPREIQRVNENLQPDDKGRYAFVQLYGSDYGGTTLGPFKTVFTLTQVKPLEEGAKDVGYFMWWKYWGTSLVNKAFKEQHWGINPNHLAVVDTAYGGRLKAVRLIERGNEALRLVWNSARFHNIVEIPQHLVFRTVARRPAGNGENEIEMDAISLKRSNATDTLFPFDSQQGDEFKPSPSSEIGRDLRDIGFKPVAWQCMLNYGGVVKF